ncbi:MAG: DJ-1/PfpI family protein [Treponema sp.]|jgi:4-methyl-5(b-hydroxyethyl)-thiazole monophosphate biosynthesis|nr:DJ-1/PfpI family protein [Treponema sp.]
MEKKTIIFLAEGFEEVEAVTPIDYLRRANIEVTIIAIGKEKAVKGSHGIILMADTTLEEMEQAGRLKSVFWDGAFIPGGMPGAANLAACTALGNFFKEMAGAGKIIAAICASPAVFLAPLGLLEGKKFTCYPGMEKQICTVVHTTVHTGTWIAEKVVVDGNLVTGRGPGTAAVFALALIELLAGKEAAKTLSNAALL